LPYAIKLADKGWKKACKDDPALAAGVNMVEGKVTFKPVADLYHLPYEPVEF
jgi:alanine dehydrogenase